VEVAFEVHVGVVGRDAEEVVDVDELAVLDEQRAAPKREPWAKITPRESAVSSTSARIRCTAGYLRASSGR
jgi:hypothetical protein